MDRKIREHQARVMLEDNKAYRYSAAINDLLAKKIGRASSVHYPTPDGEASGTAGDQGEGHDG